MELDQVRAFLAVAHHGTFSRAAQVLLRTQPAISIKIRTLETDIGHQLLERRQRGVSLTPAGEIFRRRAESVCAELEALSMELADLSARKIGRVALGASDTVCLYLLPQIAKRFVQKYPGIELKLSTQISRRVLELIQADQIDIGIVTLPVTDKGIATRELYRDRFLLIFPPGHPLESKRHVRPTDLHPHPIIHLKSETVTRNWIDRKLEPFGLKGQVRMEVSTIEVIKRLVEAGLGISLLPEMAVTEEVRAGRLRAVKLQGIVLTRSVGLAYRREKYFSLALTAFVEDITAYTQSL
jgi:DNA-binding transcriptional LysR family regulator